MTHAYRDGEPILGLDRDLHGACDRALSDEVEDNRRLVDQARHTANRDALILRLLDYVGPEDTERTLRAAIHHVRLFLGQPGQPDPALIRRLLHDIGGAA